MLSLFHLFWKSEAVTWSNGADPGLSLQFALRVFICDPGGYAHPTAAGALGPFSRLNLTLFLLPIAPDWGKVKAERNINTELD